MESPDVRASSTSGLHFTDVRTPGPLQVFTSLTSRRHQVTSGPIRVPLTSGPLLHFTESHWFPWRQGLFTSLTSRRYRVPWCQGLFKSGLHFTDVRTSLIPQTSGPLRVWNLHWRQGVTDSPGLSASSSLKSSLHWRQYVTDSPDVRDSSSLHFTDVKTSLSPLTSGPLQRQVFTTLTSGHQWFPWRQGLFKSSLHWRQDVTKSPDVRVSSSLKSSLHWRQDISDSPDVRASSRLHFTDVKTSPSLRTSGSLRVWNLHFTDVKTSLIPLTSGTLQVFTSLTSRRLESPDVRASSSLHFNDVKPSPRTSGPLQVRGLPFIDVRTSPSLT